MADVYEGVPDRRQADKSIKVSRFRPRYRALTDEEKQLHDAIKDKAAELELLIELGVPNGRYKALAMTDLELAIMWAVKGLTS